MQGPYIAGERLLAKHNPLRFLGRTKKGIITIRRIKKGERKLPRVLSLSGSPGFVSPTVSLTRHGVSKCRLCENGPVEPKTAAGVWCIFPENHLVKGTLF